MRRPPFLTKRHASTSGVAGRFVAAHGNVSSSTWRSLAVAIRPFNDSTAGEVVSMNEIEQGCNTPAELAQAVLDGEMIRTLQQAELAAPQAVSDQPRSKEAGLSQLEVTLYSMLLTLAMLSMTCFKMSNTILIEKTLATIVWELSLQFRDLTPEAYNEEADQHCHNDKSLVALLAHVVITLRFTGPRNVRQIELRGLDTGFHFPFDLLCSLKSFHPSLQQAAAAEIGCRGSIINMLAQLDLVRLLCVFAATRATARYNCCI